jgi:ribosomal protein S18 acetylase RimI-like enzyme
MHVDPSNDAAQTLYEKEGYVNVGKRWSVMWAGGADYSLSILLQARKQE